MWGVCLELGSIDAGKSRYDKCLLFMPAQNLYDRSFERFQYYTHQSASRNPKVIEKLKTQYPVFAGYLAFFVQNLKESSKIARLNSFGCEEEVWYMVPFESYVFLISVREII